MRRSAAKQGQHGESLGQAVRGLAYWQITAFAILTVAFAAPLSCQQHALMSLLDVDWTVYSLHLAHGGTAFPCALHEHQPGAAMVLSTFAGIAPQVPALLTLPRPTDITITPILFPSKFAVIPPEQPPRVM